MKTQELRIGNWVNETAGFQIIVTELGEDCIGSEDHLYKESECSGTPLTFEWLKRAGFKQGDNTTYNDSFYVIAVGGSELGINPDNGVVWIIRGTNVFNNPACIDYVHQLQNLYFSLTGQELNFSFH